MRRRARQVADPTRPRGGMRLAPSGSMRAAIAVLVLAGCTGAVTGPAGQPVVDEPGDDDSLPLPDAAPARQEDAATIADAAGPGANGCELAGAEAIFCE